MQEIFFRVAEDYAPFNVDVTTQAPSAAAIDRASASDQVYGTTVVITNGPEILDDCLCGGASLIHAFDEPDGSASGIDDVGAPAGLHAYLQPAFVFPPALAFTKDIADAASHEAGHTLGLEHDGQTLGDPYYAGHGPWAPIMGVGYETPIGHWSKGEYPLADNQEDDLAIIASNGPTLVPDDHGNTGATATQLGAGPQYAGSGVIGTDADIDAFTVTVSGGQLTFAAAPVEQGPNLDIRLELRDATTLLDSDDPPVQKISASVASGIGRRGQRAG